MNQQINYCLPGFFTGFKIYQFLLDIYKNYKYIFYDNINFYRIFDSFPNCTWNGGTTNFGHSLDLNDMASIIEFYNSENVGLQFTATNPLLTKEDCYDRYGNTIIKLLSKNSLNEVLVSSKNLENYLRDKYPNINISRSIIATKEDIDYNSLVDQYHHIVLPKRMINNFELLKNISPENRHKMELLCNDPCPIDCKRLYEHYNSFARISLFEQGINQSVNCSINKEKLNNPLYQILPEDINRYLQYNFNLFKISGRSSEIDIVKSIIPYLIKPKYQFEIACDLFFILR